MDVMIRLHFKQHFNGLYLEGEKMLSQWTSLNSNFSPLLHSVVMLNKSRNSFYVFGSVSLGVLCTKYVYIID